MPGSSFLNARCTPIDYHRDPAPAPSRRDPQKAVSFPGAETASASRPVAVGVEGILSDSPAASLLRHGG